MTASWMNTKHWVRMDKLNKKVIVGANFHRDRIAKLIAGRILNFECG